MANGGCVCCGRINATFAAVRAPDGLPTRTNVCGLCARHQGNLESDFKKRNDVHIEMWREDLREREEELETIITDLRQELLDRPVQSVNVHIDQPILDEAREGAQRAFRSRDSAFVALTRLHMLHFEATADKCRCGRKADDCDERRVLDGSKALRAWEKRQSDARRRGDWSLLPRDHPGVVDARWDPDEEDLKLYEELRDSDL